MPVEGLETTGNGNAQGDAAGQQAQGNANTSDATAQNTGANQTTGAATQAAQTTEATDKTFTQADVDRIVANRVKSAVKAELKKLGGETEGGTTVEQLQQQLNEEKGKRQAAEARQSVRDYISDPKNKLNVPGEAQSTIVKLAMLDIQFDKDGSPSNVKEVIESLKASDPRLFATTPSNINAGNGRDNQAAPTNMNDFIRQTHAARN